MNTSPGMTSGKAAITARTASGIEPRWIGKSGPCATMLPARSKMPQE
jgi:hypothetical protein